MRPGTWYFDQTRREFIYVLNLADNFTPGADGRTWVRYRVVIQFESMPDRGAPQRRVVSAVNFSLVQPYVWF